jgi:threonylcarbamoyladenosine tRNA methylthiotransferase MtaB
MNWLDSAQLRAALQAGGHTEAEQEEEAESILINSCTVTKRADRQVRQEILHAMGLQKKVIVFGCGPKVEKKEWEERFPNISVLPHKEEVIEYFGISKDQLEFPLHDRTRIPVAIQTGCDNKCTFCITRIARGKTRDFPKEKIVRHIQQAEKNGIQEIVITGIQLASWGCGNSLKYPEKSQFATLLSYILKNTNIPRIRMSSLGPQFLNDEFFNVLKNPRICDHLHLSVQSGSPNILQKMNRGHSEKEIYEVVKKAKQIRPNGAITADIIVGFPGETEKDFQETVTMAKKIQFSKIHVFPFSPREKTGAAHFPKQISSNTKKYRAQHLRQKAEELRKNFFHTQIGKKTSVLVEERETGFSTNYIRLIVPKGRSGEIRNIQISQNNIKHT